MHVELFPKICKAVTAMSECCTDSGTSVAKSEVYNETWLLRMVLACIHDYKGDFVTGDAKIKKVLEEIRKVVSKRWISEGGLEPAFENEGTTWTDAILGDVRLRGESADDDEEMGTDGNKRKVELTDISTKEPGVVIVEAKMGSPLDKSVTNSKDYDQFARNIACLAKLLLKVDESVEAAYLKNSAVVVFMPHPVNCLKLLPELDDDQNERMRVMLEDRKVLAETFRADAVETINKQVDERKDEKGKTIERRSYAFDEKKGDRFNKIVDTIGRNSKILTWDEIIGAMADENENKDKLKNFYIQALKEIVPKKKRRRQ